MAFNFSPKIVTDGLVLYLDAANTKSYPGSGNTWRDLSKSQLNGTLTNGPTFNSDNGGSIVFDGSNDFINIGTNTTYYFNQTNPFTLSCWFKPIDLLSGITNTYALINRFNGNVLGNYILWIVDLKLQIYREVSPFNAAVSTTVLQNNNYYHCAAVYNGVDLRIYLNGLLDSNIVTSGNIAANQQNISLIVGSSQTNSGPSRAFKGNIYQTLIYNRSLSASEVLQNYNATKTRFGL